MSMELVNAEQGESVYNLKDRAFGWEPEELPLQVNGGPGKTARCHTHKAVCRDDNHAQLGIVGVKYTPIANSEIAEMASAIVEESEGHIEPVQAGSLYGGKRIFMILRGERFQASDGDSIESHIGLLDSKDGSVAFSSVPMANRIVCGNQMAGLIAAAKQSRNGFSLSLRHTASIRERMEDARVAIRKFLEGVEIMRETSQKLASRQIQSEAERQEFFTEVYQRFVGEIPANPQTKPEKRKRDKASEALSNWEARYLGESAKVGDNLFVAANAVTEWIEHSGFRQSRDEEKRQVRHMDNSLFGNVSDKTAKVYRCALEKV